MAIGGKASLDLSPLLNPSGGACQKIGRNFKFKRDRTEGKVVTRERNKGKSVKRKLAFLGWQLHRE